jgi:hypothetical protein
MAVEEEHECLEAAGFAGVTNLLEIARLSAARACRHLNNDMAIAV